MLKYMINLPKISGSKLGGTDLSGKKTFTFLCVLFSALIIGSTLAYSAPVNIETAKQAAMNWYSERIYEGSKFKIVETFIEKDNSEDIYYIFNFTPDRFIIVSADDIVVPILGYSSEQNYGLENHPPQFDAMLACFKDQIVYAKKNRLSDTREIKDEWERLEVKTEDFKKIRDIKDISPLLDPIAWNQGWNWNEYCPADAAGPGGHVYAGCVATATAQVMKYWNHPTTGTGSHSYSCPPYGTLSADFGATTYDWASMLNTTASHDTKTLLYHIGVGVEMNYGPSGSGAWVGQNSPNALTALKDYFKYDLSAYFAEINNYSTPAWEDMICNELDNGRPLVYCGFGYNPWWSGHAFNLDGYQGTNYFHFNWGWSGAYNGYYYLTNLNPGSYNFTTNQGGIFYLFPSSIGSIEGIVTLDGGTSNLEEVDITAGGHTVNPYDINGNYTINILPGTYNVTASLDGYRDSTIVGVEVFADQVTGGIDFTLEVYNGPPDWEPITGTQYHMFLNGGITLEGEQFEGIGDNMAGAFCWTDSLECRGIATWQAAGFWFFYIVSNVNIGEETTFMIYDSETDTIYNCNETIIFENGTTIGTSSNPYQLTASHYSTGGEYQLLSTKLNSNFPNPFNHSTTISFSLKEKSNVKLYVYNIKGQLVETLIDEEMNPGRDYKIIWDGKSGNKELANGIYLYKFETKNKTFIKKMILMK